jgi:AcrR family transcriptional regulator
MANQTETPDRRARIVDAARKVLSEQGYSATTIKAIARAAGVAPGLVHYYFASKEDLLVEVLRSAAHARRDALSGLMSSAERAGRGRASMSPSQRARRGAASMQDVVRHIRQQPDVYRLRFELFALGLRDEALQPGTRELLERGRTGIASFLSELGDPRAARPLASVLLACFDGLALQHLIEPDFDVDAAFDVLTRMAQAVLIQPSPHA